MATAKFLTLEDVAIELAVSRERIWKLIRCGQLPAVNLANNPASKPTYRVSRADLEAFIQMRKTEVRNV